MQSEISRQVEARKQSNPQAQRNKAIYQIGRLVASRSLALRSADYKLAQSLEEEIIRLGGDPATGELVEPSPKDGAGGTKEVKEDYDERIRRINEKNRQRTKEAMAAAHQASIQRKKAEEAIIRQRQSVYKITKEAGADGQGGIKQPRAQCREASRPARVGPAQRRDAAAVCREDGRAGLGRLLGRFLSAGLLRMSSHVSPWIALCSYSTSDICSWRKGRIGGMRTGRRECPRPVLCW